MAQQFQNFIGGQWVAPRTGQYLDNRNPADWEEVLGAFPQSGPEDVEAAGDDGCKRPGLAGDSGSRIRGISSAAIPEPLSSTSITA